MISEDLADELRQAWYEFSQAFEQAYGKTGGGFVTEQVDQVIRSNDGEEARAFLEHVRDLTADLQKSTFVGAR